MLLRLVFISSFFLSCYGAFIQTQKCPYKSTTFKLAPFIVDAKLYEDERLLTFLISSKVISNYNNTLNTSQYTHPDQYIGILDVNFTTNTYTTLSVNIDFMGKSIISERLRFCDYVVVKNSTGSTVDPRLPGYIAPAMPESLDPGNNVDLKRDIFDVDLFDYDSIKRSHDNDNFTLGANVSLPDFFHNSTGQLMQCPLYVNDSILIYYEANITQHFHKFGSYSASFTVIDNDEQGSIMGCTELYVTPIQPEVILNVILYGVIVLLVVTSLVNLFTIVNSSYQESSNPFLYKASTFCNTKLLKQLDANVTRIIVYLQFALFIGGLGIQYPGFYQPLISQLRWAALLGSSLIGTNDSDPANTDHFDVNNPPGNIYTTYNSGGIKSLSSFTYDSVSYEIWPNFMVCLALWLCLQSVAQEFFLLAKFSGDKLVKCFNHRNKSSILNDNGFEFTIRKNFYFIFGQIFHSLFNLFAVPFIVLTSYMFEAAANNLNKTRYIPSISTMQMFAFSFTTPYDAIEATSCKRHPPDDFDAGDLFKGGFNTSEACLSSKVKGMPVYQPIVGSIAFFVWFALATYFVFHYLISFVRFKIIRNKRISRLYTSMKTILLWSFLYHDYHPDKSYFTAIDLLMLALKSIVIGALQQYGFVQVILLIVLEFVDLLLLFLIRPYFVGLSWTSSRCWIPVARFLVTVLCIPYIRELKISEATRTYVAYAQLLIHIIVAAIFILQLIYCLVITILSIRNRESNKKFTEEKLIKSEDDFNFEFDYKPINLLQKSKEKYIDEIPQQEEDDNTSMEFYYRGRSNDPLRIDSGISEQGISSETENNNANVVATSTTRNPDPIPQRPSNQLSPRGFGVTDAISLGDSFTEEEHFSNLRKLTTNYCVREGDNVYNKYFIDETIDPEVKALWASRNLWENASDSKDEKHKFARKAEKLMPMKLFSKPPVESGFHVSRPRKLVVRTLSQIEESEQLPSKMPLDTSSSLDELDFTVLHN